MDEKFEHAYTAYLHYNHCITHFFLSKWLNHTNYKDALLNIN